MADFIRPAARAHWFDQENDMEWGTSSPFDEEPVSHHPEVQLIPHLDPSESGALPATPAEADWFWRQGGWDE